MTKKEPFLDDINDGDFVSDEDIKEAEEADKREREALGFDGYSWQRQGEWDPYAWLEEIDDDEEEIRKMEERRDKVLAQKAELNEKIGNHPDKLAEKQQVLENSRPARPAKEADRTDYPQKVAEARIAAAKKIMLNNAIEKKLHGR